MKYWNFNFKDKISKLITKKKLLHFSLKLSSKFFNVYFFYQNSIIKTISCACFPIHNIIYSIMYTRNTPLKIPTYFYVHIVEDLTRRMNKNPKNYQKSCCINLND